MAAGNPGAFFRVAPVILKQKHLSTGGIAFAIAAIVAILVCVPDWKATGFIR